MPFRTVRRLTSDTGKPAHDGGSLVDPAMNVLLLLSLLIIRTESDKRTGIMGRIPVDVNKLNRTHHESIMNYVDFCAVTGASLPGLACLTEAKSCRANRPGYPAASQRRLEAC